MAGNHRKSQDMAGHDLKLLDLAASPCAEKVGRLRDSTASVLSRTGPSCGSA